MVSRVNNKCWPNSSVKHESPSDRRGAWKLESEFRSMWFSVLCWFLVFVGGFVGFVFCLVAFGTLVLLQLLDYLFNT